MRFQRSALLAIAIAVSTVGQPASAQPAPDRKDLECLVISFAAGSDKDEAKKGAAAISAFYFLGKIDSRTPGVDLEKPIVALVESTAPKDYETMAKRCADELQSRGKSLSDLGDRLRAVGK